MAIVAKGFPKTKLDEYQAKAIKAAFKKKVDRVQPGEVILKLKDFRFKNNTLIAICLDKEFRIWLIEV